MHSELSRLKTPFQKSDLNDLKSIQKMRKIKELQSNFMKEIKSKSS